MLIGENAREVGNTTGSKLKSSLGNHSRHAPDGALHFESTTSSLIVDRAIEENLKTCALELLL